MIKASKVESIDNWEVWLISDDGDGKGSTPGDWPISIPLSTDMEYGALSIVPCYSLAWNARISIQEVTNEFANLVIQNHIATSIDSPLGYVFISYGAK